MVFGGESSYLQHFLLEGRILGGKIKTNQKEKRPLTKNTDTYRWHTKTPQTIG